MNKLLAVSLALGGFLNVAQAAPTHDEIDKFLASKGLASRLSDRIAHATDHAADLVVNAMGALGVPYRLGGTSAATGFDCSGFLRAMYEQTVGTLLPRRAEEQAAATRKIDQSELKPGDLVFFNTLRRAYSHVGIYVGEGKFIHAPRTGARVRVESMQISYWQSRFNGARRVLTDAPVERAAAATERGATPSERAATPSERAATARIFTRESPAPSSVRLGGSYAPPASYAPPMEQNAFGGDSI